MALGSIAGWEAVGGGGGGGEGWDDGGGGVFELGGLDHGHIFFCVEGLYYKEYSSSTSTHSINYNYNYNYSAVGVIAG